MVFVTVDDTGKTAELLEKALNGPVPLVIVTVLGTPEKTVTAAGSTVRMGETTGGSLLHIELQSSNDSNIAGNISRSVLLTRPCKISPTGRL